MNFDNKCMERALEISYERMGLTSPNPPVGAVIEKNGEIIGEGGTREYGGDHGEVDAIKNTRGRGHDLHGASMYVSLEPCSHYGKTPPCTKAIIESGIRKVFLPVMDPNPLVAGNGVRDLQENGVEVEFMRGYRNEGSDMIRPFKKYILRKKPYVIHKSAMTFDGKTASGTGHSKWITSDFSRYLVHRLRAKADAVVIGKSTFEKDSPGLNVRLDSFDREVRDYFSKEFTGLSGYNNYFLKRLAVTDIKKWKDPVRVVVGIPENIDSNEKFVMDGNYLIFSEKEKIEGWHEDLLGDRLVPLEGEDKRENIHQILNYLYDAGVLTVMLEGGSVTAGYFFEANEIDQFMYFMAPKIMASGIPVLESAFKRTAMNEALFVHNVSCMLVKNDICINGYREVYHNEMM